MPSTENNTHPQQAGAALITSTTTTQTNMALTKFSTLLSSQRTNTHHHGHVIVDRSRATSSEYRPRCMMSTRGDRTPPRPSRRRPRGAPTPTRHGRCPPRLGCRSALPRLRTNLAGCQLPSPALARRCMQFRKAGQSWFGRLGCSSGEQLSQISWSASAAPAALPSTARAGTRTTSASSCRPPTAYPGLPSAG
jgi:hypothetical protein